MKGNGYNRFWFTVKLNGIELGCVVSFDFSNLSARNGSNFFRNTTVCSFVAYPNVDDGETPITSAGVSILHPREELNIWKGRQVSFQRSVVSFQYAWLHYLTSVGLHTSFTHNDWKRFRERIWKAFLEVYDV